MNYIYTEHPLQICAGGSTPTLLQTTKVANLEWLTTIDSDPNNTYLNLIKFMSSRFLC